MNFPDQGAFFDYHMLNKASNLFWGGQAQTSSSNITLDCEKLLYDGFDGLISFV
jgi:hypothetical protein